MPLASGLLPVLVAVALLLSASTTTAQDAGGEHGFPLLDKSALQHLLNCRRTPRPSLILFMEKDTPELTRTMSVLQRILPDNSISFFGLFRVAADDTETREVLLGGHQLPAFGVFCSTLGRHSAEASPVFIPHFRPATLQITDLANWAFSEVPVQFADPLTSRLLPSVHFPFDMKEVRELVTMMQDWVMRFPPHASAVPQGILLAYVHLTTDGSVSLLPAIASLAAQSGGRAVAFLTESANVAAFFGLSSYNTSVAVTWDTLQTALQEGSATVETMSAPRELTNSNIRAAVEEITGTLVHNVGGEDLQKLADWRAAVDAYEESTALRSFSNQQQLVQELGTRSVKLIFFLRASDELKYATLNRMARRVANALRQHEVPYTDSAGKERVWQRTIQFKVYMVDAEQKVSFASFLGLRTVPAVAVVVPLRRDHETEASGVTIAGVHFINHYDLRASETSESVPSIRSKVLGSPAFPTRLNDLLKFLMCPSFFDRVKVDMHTVSVDQAPWEGDATAAGPSEMPTTFIRDVVLGDVILPPYNPHTGDEEEALDLPQLVARANVSEEKKQQWRDEFNARRQAKLERIKYKSSKDAFSRVKDSETLKQKILQEVASARHEQQHAAGKVLTVLRPEKPPKNAMRHSATALHHLWKEDTERMAALYVYKRKGKVVTQRTFEQH